MTLDARALVAIILKEPGFEEIVSTLAGDENPRVPATALAEAGMILSARADTLAELRLQILIDQLHLTVVPFTNQHWRGAIRSYEVAAKAKDAVRPRLGQCLSEAVAAKLGSAVIRR